MAHTPGPWTYQRLHPFMKGCPIGTGDLAIPTASTLIATAWNTTKGLSGPQDAETEANARLIAAAPELLDSLVRLIDSDGGCDFTGDEPQETCPGENDPHYGIKCPWCQARAAIAKATSPQAR